jgi:uncharacterized FAD-dependent dehydrogenase
MIRIAELKLPLSAVEYHPENHTEYQPTDKLTQLAAERLGIAAAAIAKLHVHKRSFDARKAELLAVYIVDITLADEARRPRC